MMQSIRKIFFRLIPLIALAIAGCGGGEPPSSEKLAASIANAPAWQPPAGATPANGNYIYLEISAGVPMAPTLSGGSYLYTPRNSFIYVSANQSHLLVSAVGNEGWNADFQIPLTPTQLQAGYYSALPRYDYLAAAKGGLYWGHFGDNICPSLKGWFTVDNVTYANGALASVDVRFAQQCDGTTGVLRGKIHWNITDTTTPPGPIDPPPADLWQPPAGSTPTSGNYIYLQSAARDPVGKGFNYLLTLSNATFSLSEPIPGHLNVHAYQPGPNLNWSGDFQNMLTKSGATPLHTGYYGGLREYWNYNPTKGGLRWLETYSQCTTLRGWFAIDSVTYANGVLTAIDLRFAQSCDGATDTLKGKIHWDANDTTAPPLPVDPPPPNLWQPPAGVTPTDNRNYIYLQSDAGDGIGLGRSYLYTPANSAISLRYGSNTYGTGAGLTISIWGDQQWSGGFTTMYSISQVQKGYYGGVERAGGFNPLVGKIEWLNNSTGRGCNTISGWYVVDDIAYSNGSISSLDLRFEQHCDESFAALRGKIHWTSTDKTLPPGPVYPVPSTLWQPAAGATPASGNYVYLKSDPGDFVGAAWGSSTYLYTPSNSIIDVSGTGNVLTTRVNALPVISGAEWNGIFSGMSSINQLQPGYYGGLQRQIIENPARGGLDWNGGAACNTLIGWFAVDSISYVNGAVSAVDLRFGQHCTDGGSGSTAALRGKIHWVKP